MLVSKSITVPHGRVLCLGNPRSLQRCQSPPGQVRSVPGGSCCSLDWRCEHGSSRWGDERSSCHSAFMTQEVESGTGIGLQRELASAELEPGPDSPQRSQVLALTVSCTSTAMPRCLMARSTWGGSRSVRSPVPTTTISGERRARQVYN